jgi:aryl-alcohol dehydrogenase-like predicted oxidoreductase
MSLKPIATRDFGKTGRSVTMVGLGGEGILRTYGRTQQAAAMIQAAIEQGVTYFDCAHVYADSELYYGSIWKAFPEKRAGLFQASKSASRDKKGALTDLENSLRRLQTDYLDLWQIHDVRTDSDFNQIAGPGGALEAFTAAKASGKVRHIGVTGHHDPRILTRAVTEWPVDSVMMPVNPAEAVIGGFLTSTLPAAQAKNMAVIGMKILGAAQYILPEWGVSADMLIRFAVSCGITLAIVGCSSEAEVRTLAHIGRNYVALSEVEKNHLTEQFKPYAKRLTFYREVF